MEKKQEYTFKKAFICLMLCVYVFGLIKPVMPVIKDVLAHTFFKAEHISTVHYENGKYHIHLELQQEVKKGDTKHIPVVSNNESLSSHIKSEDITFEVYLKKISDINSPYLDAPIDIFISTPLLPPEC